jgi:hypothetical protein
MPVAAGAPIPWNRSPPNGGSLDARMVLLQLLLRWERDAVGPRRARSAQDYLVTTAGSAAGSASSWVRDSGSSV